jgi:hypothetical protein
MPLDHLIPQDLFIDGLVNGVPIPAQSSTELYTFGTRLIDFINDAHNDYWAGWHPTRTDQLVIDRKNIHMIDIALEAGKLIFLMPNNGAAQDLPKEFGHGAVGVMLFCMIENEQLMKSSRPDVIAEEKPKGPRPSFDML